MSGQDRRAAFERDGIIRRVALVSSVAVLYVLSARLGLVFAFVGDQVTPLWPPTGVALVALMLFGRTVVPGITLGALFVNLPLGPSIPAAAGIALGNTLAPWVAFELLARARFDHGMRHLRDVVSLIILGACLSMAISATVGASVLLAANVVTQQTFLGTWLVWWTGDAMGVLVVAPLLLVVRSLRSMTRTTAIRIIETVAILSTTTVVGAIVTHADLSLLYLVLPCVTWAAVRLQMAGAAPAVAIASTAATIAASNGAGPFRGLDVTDTMVVLQAFNAACALIGFMLAALTTERNNALVTARAARVALEARVQARTAELSAMVERLEHSEWRLEEAQRTAHIGSWEWDIGANVVGWSDELFRLYGLEPGSMAVDYAGFVARLHPDDRPLVEQVITQAYQDGLPFSFDHRVVWPDGSIHWLHGRGRVMLNDEGAPMRMLGTAQDIEDRKSAERAAQRLHDAETRRRQALELNDEIVQGLTVAAYASDSGDVDATSRAIRGTLSAARHIVAELLGDDGDDLAAGDLVRERAAQVPWRKTG